jgi:hypothetical protein
MKKLAFYLLTTCLLLALQPMQLIANDLKAETLADPKSIKSEVARTLIIRLNEVETIDRKDLNFLEKKELRNELRSIKHELREVGGGLYFSDGAAILIVILLIALL